MNYKLITFFILIIAINLSAQNTTLNKGEIIKDRQFLLDKNEITVADNEGNFVSIRPKKNNGVIHDYFVEFFNNLNFSERIEFKNINRIKILKTFIKNEKVYLFIKEELDNGFLLRFDLVDIKSKKITQKIALEIDKSTSPSLYKSLKNDNNIFLEESSKIILTIPVVENKKTIAFVKIFSENLENLSQHEIFPDENLSFKYANFLNTSQFNNKVYLLFNLTLNKEEKIYRLIELSNGDEKNLDIPIETSTYELIASKIKNTTLVICGLYSKKRKGGFEGVTSYKIDLNSFSVTSQIQSQFSNSEVSNYFKGFFNKKRSLDIKNIFVDDKLNTYLVCQFYRIRRQAIPIMGITAQIGSSFFITYNPISVKYKLYDDLLIYKINLDGKLNWDKILEFKLIEKSSSKSNKLDSSVFAFLLNNKVNIFLNGYINPKKEKVLVKQDKKFSKTNFYNVIFNNEGRMDVKTIFSNAGSKIIFRTGKTVQSNKVLYNLGQGNMRKQLLQIRF